MFTSGRDRPVSDPASTRPEYLLCADGRGGAVAQDGRVVVIHFGGSWPACSRTMYSAYQSGQFESACPVRASCCPWAAAARRSALARSFADAKVVVAGSTRPASRVVISWNSQPLPSGSLNEANER